MSPSSLVVAVATATRLAGDAASRSFAIHESAAGFRSGSLSPASVSTLMMPSSAAAAFMRMSRMVIMMVGALPLECESLVANSAHGGRLRGAQPDRPLADEHDPRPPSSERLP